MVGVGLRHLVVAIREDADIGAVKVRAAVGLAVEEPEGDVDALDLLDVVLVAEDLGQADLALVVVLELGNGRLLVNGEGDDVVWLERSAELAGDDGVVAAIRALGHRRDVADDHRRAAG